MNKSEDDNRECLNCKFSRLAGDKVNCFHDCSNKIIVPNETGALCAWWKKK